MAYSDYGGRVYRNGERREDRCDAVLSPEGIQSTPGSWPGWTIPEGRSGSSYHALLGDGPIFVGLLKQSYVALYRLGEKLELLPLLINRIPGGVYADWNPPQVDESAYRDDGTTARFEVDGYVLEVRWTDEDNYYQYVRLTQPDGNVWTGWAGYGVGAGLEDGDHGFDSEPRDAMLAEIFPA